MRPKDSFHTDILSHNRMDQRQISEVTLKHYKPRGPKHKRELFSSLLGEMETRGDIVCEYDQEGIVQSLRVIRKEKMVYVNFPIRFEYVSGMSPERILEVQ
jgi:hypothetical protein